MKFPATRDRAGPAVSKNNVQLGQQGWLDAGRLMPKVMIGAI